VIEPEMEREKRLLQSATKNAQKLKYLTSFWSTNPAGAFSIHRICNEKLSNFSGANIRL
jgi:hypothetical protein